MTNGRGRCTNLGKGLDEFFWADIREPLEFHVGQLLCQDRGRWAQLGDVHLKNGVTVPFVSSVEEKRRREIMCKSVALVVGVRDAMKGRRQRELDSQRCRKTESGNGRKLRVHVATPPLFLSNFTCSCFAEQIRASSYLRRTRFQSALTGGVATLLDPSRYTSLQLYI